MRVIALTDPTPLPVDERCPRCGAGREHRRASITFGPVHDVCGQCFYDFQESTVVEVSGDDE